MPSNLWRAGVDTDFTPGLICDRSEDHVLKQNALDQELLCQQMLYKYLIGQYEKEY